MITLAYVLMAFYNFQIPCEWCNRDHLLGFIVQDDKTSEKLIYSPKVTPLRDGEIGLTLDVLTPSPVLTSQCCLAYRPLWKPMKHRMVKQSSLRTWKRVQLGGISLSLFEALPWLHVKLYNFSGFGSRMDAGYWQALYLIWENFSSTCIKRLEKKNKTKTFHIKGI